MQRFFNYQLVESLDEILFPEKGGKAVVVNCLNPHSFVMATEDGDFQQALEKSDYLLPDGEGIVMSLKRWRGKSIHKIAGDDLHRHLLEKIEREGGKIFYMGSTAEVLQEIKARIQREHAGITVDYLSPSFCNELSDEESQSIANTINAFAPDVLFVSMTAPKQEKWVYKHLEQLESPRVIASIGAVFDFYAGRVKRAPRWAVKMKIEWLVRLVKEPRRMWSRNFVSTPKYLRWVRKHRKEM